MKHYLTFFLLFLLFINDGFTNGKDSLTYKTNETLKYLMYYGWIDGGYATISLSEDTFKNEKCYHSTMVAETKGITNRLYHVKDIYESYFDIDSGLPNMAIRNIREGKYTDYNEVEFYNADNYVVSQKSGKVNVPEKCLDIISSIYYTRNLIRNADLENDSIIRAISYFGDEVFPLVLRYIGTETIETDLGEINCLKFMPVTEVGRVFKTEDDMTIWFSNDDNIIPIRVKFELFIGSLKCDLIEYSNLKNDLNIQ